MHDNTARQVELEAYALELGGQRYEKGLTKQGHADSAPGQRLVMHYLEPLAEEYRAWIECEGAGRRRGVVALVRNADPEELAALTLRSLLTSYSLEFRYMSAAVYLGGLIEEHLGWKAAMGNDDLKAYARKVSQSLAKVTSERHTRAVARHVLRNKDESFEPWTRKQQASVGMHLIERLVSVTGLFEKQNRGVGHRTFTVLEAKDVLREYLDEGHSRCIVPVHLPMVVKPRDWVSPSDGGYLSRRLPLIKGKSVHSIDAEYADADLSEVYEVVNTLQGTAWRINKGVFEVMREAWASGARLASLPSQEDEPVPAKPDDIATNEEARKAWRERAAIVHRENGEERSKRFAMSSKIAIGERMLDEDELFFVHNLDWRGRVYPVGTQVHPQGDDSGRALLHAKEGLPLGEYGAYWLAVHIANCFGYDKVSFDDRVRWTEEHSSQILDSSKNPLDGMRFWCEADKPWSFLAAAMEWAGYVEEGEDFITHIPIGKDGSCNGLQHFSAMLRDPAGGRATNLVPAELPQDIYGLVAEAALVNLRAHEDADTAEVAEFWLQHGIDRSLVKHPVMTLPYGVTLFGMRDQIVKELRKRGTRDVGSEASFLSRVVWKSIGDVVVAARETMAWLQEVAGIAVKADKPLSWTAPSGLPVNQDYRKTRGHRVEVYIGGVKRAHTIRAECTQRNPSKQVLGISPNFIHSLDAAHMMRTVLTCADYGIKTFAMIHDSYAVLAPQVPLLDAAIRESFIYQYETNVLETFRDEVQQQMPDEVLPPLPASGSLDLAGIRESLYFFA